MIFEKRQQFYLFHFISLKIVKELEKELVCINFVGYGQRE